MLQVTAEVGHAVKQGQMLARLEDTTLREAVLSAESAVKSAEAALDVAQREATRTANLVKGGALPEREVETTQNAVTAAQAQLANAKAQQATARKQLDKATVRSPITGIVAERPANSGDIVSTGDPLYKIIEPSSMRLKRRCRPKRSAAIRVGAAGRFHGARLRYAVRRAHRADQPDGRSGDAPGARSSCRFRTRADVSSRACSPKGAWRGRRRRRWSCRPTAVNTSSKEPWVMRIKDGKAEKVTVSLGLRDEQTERVELSSGVQAGDQLLIGAAQGITPGTPVKVARAQRQSHS